MSDVVPECVRGANIYRGIYVVVEGDNIVKQTLRDDIAKEYWLKGYDVWELYQTAEPQKIDWNL